MPKPAKEQFLHELTRRYPSIKQSEHSRSLFEIRELGVRIYTRYSKVHPKGRTFFGLRRVDLDWLQGFHSLICFIWDHQENPLLIPYSDFESVFAEIAPAQDGQYKAQVDVRSDGCELYIAKAGRFNVEGYFGWNEKNLPVEKDVANRAASLSHAQVQTLLGSIGHAKGNDVWCPMSDRPSLDWAMLKLFCFAMTCAAPSESRPPGGLISILTMMKLPSSRVGVCA